MDIKLLQRSVELAKEKKASRISLMDLRGRSDICNFQMLCSGQNERQTQAIADHIEAVCKKEFGRKPFIEGHGSGHWVLLDYSSVLIHIFMDSLRDYYALENLWPQSLVAFEELEHLQDFVPQA